MSPLTVEQLHTFHTKDREIFSKLVLIFSRPPAESLLVMATWFWLEDLGFENIFSTILALKDPFIVFLANEAVTCYRCLDSDEPPPDGLNQIPLTATLMKRHISLQVIYQMRYSAIVGIRNFLNTVCSRVFSDILVRVLPSSSSSSSSFFHTKFRYPLVVPGFPDPTFGNINVMHDVVDWNSLPKNNFFIFTNGIWRWNATCIATRNERTMFITFSRGFPVTKDEVKQLFNGVYGEDCVEDVYIPRYYVTNGNACSNGQEQSLWARVVLNSVVTVDRVLEGKNLKKFLINGKHTWARKFNERNETRN